MEVTTVQTDLYQHCSRCGDELTPTEQQRAADDDSPLPPLCTSCALQVFNNVVKPLADVVSDFLRSVNAAFRPMVEALQNAEVTVQNSPTQSDDTDDDGGKDGD